MTPDMLYNIWRIAEFDYSTIEEKYSQIDAYHSIEWYVMTGRSCLAWENALKKANPKKLINFILKQDDQSVQGQVESTTKYLRRYCQYQL